MRTRMHGTPTRRPDYLNRQTVSLSTTELGRLFKILTIRAEKEYFRVSQLNSTSCNGHLFVRISITLIYIYVSDITFTDLSPVPVRSAVKSYFTPWSIQNLSRRALNTLTELTSTTWLGKLFQTFTIRAEK